jgi:hypothetical protein
MELYYGAINVITNAYEIPTEASKQNSYICPCCKKPAILRKGQIRRHHFAHRSDSKCALYSSGESEIHKAAKTVLACQLQQLNVFNIRTSCTHCMKHIQNNITLPPRYDVIQEYKFTHKGQPRIADVAVVEPSGNIHSIYEVYHTHSTDESTRPEPWFELRASDILEHKYICLRKRKYNISCDKCVLRKYFTYLKHIHSYKQSRIELYKRIITLRDNHLKYLLRKVSYRIKQHKYKMYKIKCVIQSLDCRISNKKNTAFIKLKQNASLDTHKKRYTFNRQRYLVNIMKGKSSFQMKEIIRQKKAIQFQKNRWKKFGFTV